MSLCSEIVMVLRYTLWLQIVLNLLVGGSAGPQLASFREKKNANFE
jgi:hypothetical protein